jgi:DNA polymerase-3 subunit beta
MKFTIEREQLLPALQMVNGVIERRQTLPVLANFLLSINANSIILSGTDMEAEIVATIDQKTGGSLETTLPARKLLDICKALPEQAALEFNIESDKATIKSGKSRFTLATIPAQEFPSTDMKEVISGFELPQNIFRSLLEDTMFAMAQQDVRYYLNGLLLVVSNNKLKAVATDGHRLALKEIGIDIAVEESLQIIVPRKGVGEVVRLLENSDTKAQVKISQNHIRVILPNLEFTSKLIDGRFPDYEKVIPTKSEYPVIANREKLRQSLNRASILSNEKYRGIGVILQKGNLKAHAHNPEQEEAQEELEIDYAGEEMEIGFNVTYLLDALGVIKTDNVILTIKDPNSSCLLLPEDDEQCKYVVMPMRL